MRGSFVFGAKNSALNHDDQKKRNHKILFVNIADLVAMPVLDDERQGVLNAPKPDKTIKPSKFLRACDAGSGNEPNAHIFFSF